MKTYWHLHLDAQKVIWHFELDDGGKLEIHYRVGELAALNHLIHEMLGELAFHRNQAT